jgi:hypothetical protein
MGDEACVLLVHAEPVSAVVRDFDHLTKLQYLRLIPITNYSLRFFLFVVCTIQRQIKRNGENIR